jgi:hypothetical protein
MSSFVRFSARGRQASQFQPLMADRETIAHTNDLVSCQSVESQPLIQLLSLERDHISFVIQGSACPLGPKKNSRQILAGFQENGPYRHFVGFHSTFLPSHDPERKTL